MVYIVSAETFLHLHLVFWFSVAVPITYFKYPLWTNSRGAKYSFRNQICIWSKTTKIENYFLPIEKKRGNSTHRHLLNIYSRTWATAFFPSSTHRIYRLEIAIYFFRWRHFAFILFCESHLSTKEKNKANANSHRNFLLESPQLFRIKLYVSADGTWRWRGGGECCGMISTAFQCKCPF